MTIPATTRKAGPFTGNGSTTAFPFTFKVFTTADVAVIVADVDGIESILTLDSDYSVTLNSDQDATPGGTVTYPISGTPLPSTDKLSIKGDVDYQQGTDIPTGGDFNPVVLENALDSLSMQIQQVQEAVSRAAVVPITSAADAADLVADIELLAGEIGNLDTIFANMADITTVADDLNEPVSEINTVAASIANVNTVGTNIANVNTVAGISANVTTVAGISANVTTVAGIAANVTSVAGNATNINTVAGNNSNVTTVAGVSSAVTTVAGVSSAVTTVAGISSAVSTVAADGTDIGVVAGISADVQAVADIAADVAAVENIAANVTTVAGIAANVTTVAGISPNVTTVAGNTTNINTVAGISANVTTVAGISADVTAVAADATDIGTVATNIADVNTVAADIADINTCADNMAAILDAPAQASAAAASAAAAALTYDSFDDRYLGAKASAPTLDNDGNALVSGAMYFNNGTVVADDKGMWIYDGGNWIKASSASQAILTEYKYVATASQTVFTGADANSLTLSYTPGSIIVSLNGSKLLPQDYTATSGSSITLAAACAALDELSIMSFATFNLANVYTKAEANVLLASKLATTAGAVGNTNLATDAVTTAKIANANVTVAKLSATGTASASTYLRGDDTWATVTSLPGAQGQVFTASGTFTVPAGISAVKVTVVGGGGGSGRALGGSDSYGVYGANSGGGGGGAAAIGYVTGLTAGATVAVTVGGGGSSGGTTTNGGTGGTSSFGAYASCTGGVGAVLANSTVSSNGGAGGTASGSGFALINGSAGSRVGSIGGGSYLGPTNLPPVGGSSGVFAGIAGKGYGGGASGACAYGGVAQSGAAGAAGIIIVEW